MNNKELLRSYGRELVEKEIKQHSDQDQDISKIEQKLIEQINESPLSELMYTEEEMEEVKRGIKEGVRCYKNKL